MTDSPSILCPTANVSHPPDEVDASCRVPLLVLFLGATLWLIVSSVFGMIASIKFHSPAFLADSAWLTYGRVRPAASNAFLYGFAMQAGLGVALWIIARLGQVKVSAPWLVAFGGKLWNLGVLVGVIAILAGDSTGFENLEMPRYAALILFVGYLVIGLWTVLTLHRRQERPLEPSQWFLLAALFWFPWIHSTANLLLTVSPVRGVMQSIIAWWYSANLNSVWLGLVGLGAIFFFLPRLTNRTLHSRYLALFTFWTLILFASWSGIPAGAPVPVWIPTLSAVASVMALIPVLAVAINIFQTTGCPCWRTKDNARGLFIAFGVPAFVLAGVMKTAAVLPGISSITNLTWFTVAQSQLNTFGFFAMVIFGAIYLIVPQVAGVEWPFAKAIRWHFFLAAAGIALIVLPLAVGGVLQGIKLTNPQVPFVDLSRSTLMFLRVSTIGELFIGIGNLLLAANLIWLLVRYARIHFVPVCKSFTAEIELAEVKP